jgi:hypothetical protein
MRQTFHALRNWRRRRWAKLPWSELEDEAARQGCSEADIFFDRAGQTTGAIAPARHTPCAPADAVALELELELQRR